jgi:hypothetical protein
MAKAVKHRAAVPIFRFMVSLSLKAKLPIGSSLVGFVPLFVAALIIPARLANVFNAAVFRRLRSHHLTQSLST